MNNKNPLATAGILLGVGLGGFFDGILFHQILQAHNMLSNIFFPNTIANIEINMFWDGLFHAFTLLATILGIWLLWNALNKNFEKLSGFYFIGLIFFGWGLFNIVEGIIDHFILKLHHVIQKADEAGQLYSDIGFLLSGIILCAIGMWMMGKYRKNSAII